MALMHDQIPETALAWVEAEKTVALATVIETWGSAPRQAGAQLAISGEGELAGSVSGGCVEGAVAAEAMEAMEDGQCRLLEFGVSDDDAFAVGLACGGTIRVFVEPVGIGEGIPLDLLRTLTKARTVRERVAIATDLETKARHLVRVEQNDPLCQAVREAANADRSGFVDAEGRRWFIALHNPPLKMAIVGAAHIAQPLSAMAQMTGFDVTVVDPRESFSSDARFPEVAICRDWPDEALRAYGLDARTAVVCLSHDPKIDDPALSEALASDAFYIGALGSKRTSGKREERLLAGGASRDALTRIEAPIGLDIGSKSPAEIAVAIMAQVVERLRKPETRTRVNCDAAA